jgi:hypothetical protein
MKANIHIAESGQDNDTVAATPVIERDLELTPKEETKAANKLPRAEQLNKFEKDLEAHDSGNQPA